MSIGQKNEGLRRRVRRQRRAMLRTSNDARPQDTRPTQLPLLNLYGLRVRNTQWATYVKATRERVGMTQSELARRLDIDRVTVYRWETGKSRPENAAIVQRIVELFGLDLDETLAAAGLRPSAAPATRPTREPGMDPDLVIIMRRLADPDVSPAEKATIRATLQYLAGLAERTPPKKRRREAS